MVKPVVISLAVAALSGVASAAYPSTFPFENEITEIIYPPVATPSLTFDDEDPGGYYHTYIVALAEIEADAAWLNNGMYSHHFVVAWGIAPVLDPSTFNCSSTSFVFDENTYTFDSIDGNKYCDSPKECCTHLHGKLKYRENGYAESMVEGIIDTLGQGMCTEYLNENAFCSRLNDDAVQYCNEQVMSDTERSVFQTCFDVFQHWITNCPIFKNVDLRYAGPEPEAYYDTCTPAEWWNWNALFHMPDKVCVPYSYYYPEFAKNADAGKDASKYTDASASESTAAVIAASFIALAMLL